MTIDIREALYDNAKITRHKECFLMEFPEDTFRAPIVHLQGSPYEMGYAHGFLLADKVKLLVGCLAGAMYAPFGGYDPTSKKQPTTEQALTGRQTLIKIAEQKFIPAIKEIVPEYWEEMKAFYEGAKAAGSPVTWEDIVIANTIPEVSEAPQGCSNFAAWDTSTENGELKGKLVHGVNQDFDTFGVMQDSVMNFIIKPSKGNSILGVGYQGIISPLSWVNDKGLSYGEMTCYSVNEKWPQIPHGMHGRMCAQYANSIDECYDILKKTGGTTGWINLIAEDNAQNQEGVAIELSGTQITVRREDPALKDTISVTNHFESYPGHQGYEGPSLIPGQIEYWRLRMGEYRERNKITGQKPSFGLGDLSWQDVDTLEKWKKRVVCPRIERYHEWLKANTGDINIEKAVEIQSDPELTTLRMIDPIQISSPVKLLHDIEVPMISWGVSSIYSCIFVPKDGDAFVASGKTPCQHGPFWKINLKEHLDMMKKKYRKDDKI